ncbi:hypothetical protein SDRG_09158 [Saprolegnia diclina VS20]|uniref:Uncharacterized protein n=1 Tax=Saprolegnia diclina (strain VS20) TaxID=1156394 RepID=T0RSL1_SAPDV|nr:hypothetical protein SDRG_09158 [Saprolegnia diclina VS20]EQC33172.1 hypothetical protein SDRG_09158 [Saprolegnia diclina VS20]|eukprot:XP_008613295.1 hypothetical protein SDRG_09158 [Saprolegnia diclina VS20]
MQRPAPAAREAAKLEKRLYHREKQRMYRQQEADEVQFLKTRKSLDPSRPSWRNSTLLKEPEARKLGFEWISQQLYHNVDRVLADCGFPPPAEQTSFDEFVVRETADDTFQYMWRHQLVVPVSLDVAIASARKSIYYYLSGVVWSPGSGMFIDSDMLQEVSPTMLYSHTVVSADESVNLMWREFPVRDNRCVMVSQNIHDDETLPAIKRQCNRQFWVTMEVVDETHTKVRVLYVNSQFFNKDGYVSIHEEAACWGLVDLPTDATDDQLSHRFKRHATVAGQQFLQFSLQTFSGKLLQSVIATKSVKVPSLRIAALETHVRDLQLARPPDTTAVLTLVHRINQLFLQCPTIADHRAFAKVLVKADPTIVSRLFELLTQGDVAAMVVGLQTLYHLSCEASSALDVVTRGGVELCFGLLPMATSMLCAILLDVLDQLVAIAPAATARVATLRHTRLLLAKVHDERTTRVSEAVVASWMPAALRLLNGALQVPAVAAKAASLNTAHVYSLHAQRSLPRPLALRVERLLCASEDKVCT